MSKYALLVGVNEYDDGNNLRGCCNDVDNVYGVLTGVLGYQKENIVVLKDKDATRRKIVKELYSIAAKLKSEDFGFFHFSGHGSQVADKGGDEADQKDELLCPHDMNWNKKTYITDDELKFIFSGIQDGAWLEVLLDSCHSGTATKGPNGPVMPDRGIAKTVISPYANLNLPVNRMVRAVEQVGNHVLWSGCKDDQYSSDAYLGGSYNGAFTYFWAKNYRENTKMPRHKLLKNIREDLIRRGFDQVPQLTVSHG